MKVRNLSVRNKILIYILPAIIITISLITYMTYALVKQIVMEEYLNHKEQVEAHVIDSVSLIDAGFRMLEKNIEEEMENGIIEFKDEFEKAGGDPENVSLDVIKAKMDGRFDLIIIDSQTTIIKSTSPDALNFNFMQFDKDLGKEINKIRLSKEISHERIRTNVGTGYLSKFTYISTNDHKYVLEIAYTEGGLSSIISELEPLKITKELVETNEIVSNIRVFDAYGYQFVDSGENYEPTEESLEIVKRAKKELKYEVEDGNIAKSYFFIDLSEKKQTMTDNSKVIEITYDNTVRLNKLNKITYFIFSTCLLVAIFVVIIMVILSEKITYPITVLSGIAKQVAGGDYDVIAKKISRDEIGELVDVFNSMIEKIKENFHKIEKQKEELEDYSKNLENKVENRTMELVNTKNLLKDERELFKATLLSISDGLISTDRNGKVEIMNTVAEELTGWSQEDAIGKPFEAVFHMINEYTSERCDCPVRKVLETGGINEHTNQIALLSKNGTKRPVEESAAPIRDELGNINGVVVVFRDFTEKKEKQEKILYLSYHDQLTGLYNRRFFEEELIKLGVEEKLPVTLVMLDVNGLKLVNDAFGHSVGDILLKKIAKVFKRECRTNDIVARIGGDEFVIILPETNFKQTEMILIRINDELNKEKVESINISVSCGWETKQSVEEDIMTVLKKAEDYMYRRKLSESSNMRHKTIEVIIKTLYEKNQREEKHSKRVGKLCAAIGTALSLSQDDIRELKTAGLMHDIGKIAIEDTILDKMGTLNELERIEIERHPEIGYQILSSVNEFAPLAEYVLSHHERWDGNGYPKGLKGNEIPLGARIIVIADAYDAMVNNRPYRKVLSKEAALEEIKRGAEILYDPRIVKIFIEIMN
ncbi:MAG: hypothetical protein CVU84_07060 [Firmicutes bacterium HGW-Firmicutes-1]|jgi:diguanylate cyclase (GGDEF)-like protein/PAS domain S-box-containing protein|nr:MAG: hypothetical protein CVU84_07060 [Firmicutes bacterium HGW-Firmicutes-1]